MPVMIQIRNVPDAVHRRLEVQAALAGMSLSDHLLAEIGRVAERPTQDEMRERLSGRPPVAAAVSPAETVRAERESR